MTRQSIKTLTAWGDILVVWNDKNGTIWYRCNTDKGEIFTAFMIRMVKGKYVISATENEYYIRYKGTKRNCLAWSSGCIEEYIKKELNK